MVVIRFNDADAKKKALRFLPGRFPFTTWKTGELLVPVAALGELTAQGIPFSVEKEAQIGSRNGLPVVLVPAGTAAIKPADVAQALAEDGF